MPELPEVETIKRTLENLVMNKRIEDITINWPKIIQAPEDIMHFKHLLMGEQINSMSRRGKFLLFNMQDYVLVFCLWDKRLIVYIDDENFCCLEFKIMF